MTVDWTHQWALFAPNFKDGKAHIELGGKTLYLLPGPGFGDLSHPTTQLMIDMLRASLTSLPIVDASPPVVDIGCGSGILSLSAVLLGAPSAVGIDIDPEALAHAHENALLNHLDKRIVLSPTLPQNLPPSIFLMNMIFPEQKAFAPAKWNRFAKHWIVSGILSEQRREYLSQMKEWGWKPIAEHRKEKWMGWIAHPL